MQGIIVKPKNLLFIAARQEAAIIMV